MCHFPTLSSLQEVLPILFNPVNFGKLCLPGGSFNFTSQCCIAETDVDTDVKLSEDNQEELTIGDAKEAFTDEKKAINFKGGDYNLT